MKTKEDTGRGGFPLELVHYAALPCVRTLMENCEEGKRGLGARILVIACRMDGLAYEDCIRVGKDFYYNCEDLESFRFYEIRRWIDWVYRKKYDDIYWTCALPMELDLCDKDCPIDAGEQKK